VTSARTAVRLGAGSNDGAGPDGGVVKVDASGPLHRPNPCPRFRLNAALPGPEFHPVAIAGHAR
jgi:hypothetical protein